MNITKFKILKNGKVGVSFNILLRTEGNKEIRTKASIVSNEPIQQRLANALVNLSLPVLRLLELPAKEVWRIKVMGAEFTETEKGSILGAQIYALRNLDHSPIPQEVITPHKTEAPYSESKLQKGVEIDSVFDPDCIVDLKALQQEAEKYVHSQKDQLGLFNGMQLVPTKETAKTTAPREKKRAIRKS